MDELYRKPVGPNRPDSLYRRLLQFLTWRRERQFSEKTLTVWAHHLYHFILWANERGLHTPGDITRPILERYQRHLYQYRKSNGEPLSPRTQRTQLQPLQVWFKWVVRQGFALANPACDLELPRLEKRLPRHILTVDEVEQILGLPDIDTPAGLRDRALLEVLYSSGLRRSELAALEVYDIHRSRRTLTVRLGKGKKDRVIPLGSRALGWLTAYLHRARCELQRGRATQALFLSHKGEGLTPNAITNLTSAYVKRSGIDKPGACHLFRHAMATQMLENGADVRWIQAILGHASPETTQIYTQVSIGALQAVHAATHPAEQADSEGPDGDDDVGLLADLMVEDEIPGKGVDVNKIPMDTNR